jgi:hypothetical protein
MQAKPLANNQETGIPYSGTPSWLWFVPTAKLVLRWMVPPPYFGCKRLVFLMLQAVLRCIIFKTKEFPAKSSRIRSYGHIWRTIGEKAPENYCATRCRNYLQGSLHLANPGNKQAWTGRSTLQFHAWRVGNTGGGLTLVALLFEFCK